MPRFTGSDGSQTGLASFLGNFTSISQAPQTYFAMIRLADCSLSMVTGTSTLKGSANYNSSSANYQDTLHQLASLKTKADVFANGCVEKTTGISSRAAVFAGGTSQGISVFAAAEGNGSNNAVFILTTQPGAASVVLNPIASLTAASAVAASDLNGDGNGDLVVVNGYNATSAYVSVLIGNADGTFKTAVNYPIAGDRSVAATVDDFNNDGKRDIVAVSGDQHISVLLGNGDGTFQAAQSFPAPTLPGYSSSASTPILGLIAADVNGDGKKDIVCSNGLVLLGSGTGTFTAVATPAFPFTSSSPGGFGPGLASGDLNNDGKLDLVLDTGPTISTWIGKGDGTFTQGSSYAALNNSGYVTVTDLDGDGNLDIYNGLANGGLFTGDDTARASAYVLMGKGDGTFVGAPQATGAYNGTNLGDVNGDGFPDLIAAGANGSLTVQLGNGKGAFTTSSTIAIPASFVLNGYTFTNAATTTPSTYAVADLNGDGKADLVFVDNGLTAINPGSGFPITYSYPVLFTAISNGDGTFKTAVPYAFPQLAPTGDFDNALTVTGLQVADFNHDGKNDIAFSYDETAGVGFGGPAVNAYNRGLGVLTGSGDGTFKTTPILTSTYSSNTAPTVAIVPQILSAADLNGDSKPDLIVNAPGTAGVINFQLQTILQVYVGNGDGTFKTPTTVAVGADSYGIPVIGDFNKDGKLDIATLAETSGGQAEFAVALGNGDGTFATPAISNLSGGDAIRSSTLAGADLDGDGKIDLALFDANDYSGIFYGKGDGTFTSVPAPGYIVPKDLINIAAGGPAIAIDLNKDGKTDLLAGSTVLLNFYGSAPVVTTSTTTALTSSAATITTGASITFTATVTPAAGSTATPTGTVTFYDGTTILSTGAVNGSGVATYTTSGLATGTRSITASYPGDTNFSASTSTATSVTVTATIATNTALTATATTAVGGTSITFTATVTPASGSITPGGTVTFFDGPTTLGTSTLDATGKATYTTSTLSVATHSISAAYGGASAFAASAASIAVTITAPATPDFTLSLSPASLTITVPNTGFTTLTLAPTGGFTGTAAVTCTGAPANSFCSPVPANINPVGANSATCSISLATRITTASLAPTRRGVYFAALPFGILTAVAFFAPYGRRRLATRLTTLLLAATASVCLIAAAACGGKAATPITGTTAPGTYTLTIKATSGTLTHSVPWTVTVQ